MSNNNQAGKGSKPRPVDKKTFDDNFDEIAWNKAKDVGNSTTKRGKTTYKY